jgi:carbonic anhydrase/acetyltransferase-like protein (isoleucine patch superfamily)
MGRLGALEGRVPDIHPEAWIAPGAVIAGRVTLGRLASVWYGSVLRADDDEIVVGAECNIQDQCCLHVDAGQPVLLGERVSLGHRATVHGAQVDDGALIGIGAIVLGRARVGAGALVAAGTVAGHGDEYGIVHLAVAPELSDDDARDAVLTLLASLDGPDGRARVCLPAPHPAVRALLEAGWRVTDHDLYMASDPGLLDARRAVPSPSAA